jgi:hypothetical protein
MGRLALDALGLRGTSGSLSATINGTEYGPVGFAGYGPEGLPVSTLHVDLLADTSGDGTGDTGLAGVDVTFAVDGLETSVTTDSAGRASFAFETEAVSDSVTVTVPPHVIQSDDNSAGLQPVSATSVFDEVTGAHVIDLASGDEQTLGAHYFTVSAAVSILNRSNVQVNPESLFFKAVPSGFPGVAVPTSGIYDARYHDVEYLWTFGDPRVFGALEKTFGTMNQADHAYGPIVEHTYDTPGTKAPSVIIRKWHNGYRLQAVADISLTISDQDTVFSGSNTFFIDPDADYSGAPTGAVGFTSYYDAQGALSGQNNPTRIMFRDGKTHPLTALDQWRTSYPSVYLTSQHTGSKPVLSYVPPAGGATAPWQVSNYDPGQNKDLVWDDLDVRGTWDSSTETGDNVWMYLGLGDKPSYALMNGCDMSGFNAIAQVNEKDYGHFSMTDCDVTSWASFGALCSSRFFSFRGNRIARKIDALSGGDKFAGHNDHGCVRALGEFGLVMQNDMFNRSGWVPSNFSIAGTNLYTQQPSLRLATSVIRGAFYNVQQNALEGGFETMHLYPAQAAPVLVEPINYLVERNVLLGSWMTNVCMRVFYGGGSIRNNVFVSADVDRTHTNDTGSFVSTGFSSQNNPHDSENLAAPLRITHNTIINRLSDANAADGDAALRRVVDVNSAHAFTDVADQFNLLHEPNLGVPNMPFAPVDLSQLFSSRMSAPYQTGTYGPVPSSETPLDTPTLGRPIAGSPALGSISADPELCSDIEGNLRSLPDTIGASIG